MPLENQVCSLGWSRKLESLGVKQESLFSWWHKWEGSSDEDAGKDIVTLTQHSNTVFVASAFTVAELGQSIPGIYMPFRDDSNGRKPWLLIESETANKMWEETEANARAKTLIYLIENGLLAHQIKEI